MSSIRSTVRSTIRSAIRASGSVPPASATGGTITYAGGYTIHTFNSSGTLTVVDPGQVEYLVVGGGGGGGNQASGVAGGGGGAGGVVSGSAYLLAGAYDLVIGAGGAGGPANSATPPLALNGSASVIPTVASALGGGGAGCYLTQLDALFGGSGGGGTWNGLGGAGLPGQGYVGGLGVNVAGNPGGGGGGAGGAGVAAASGCTGGVGVQSSITGTPTYYGGGGGGAKSGAGGSGGGGAYGAAGGVAGTANTGGGGGATAGTNPGGSGGSGVVIVRYPTLTGVPYTPPASVDPITLIASNLKGAATSDPINTLLADCMVVAVSWYSGTAPVLSDSQGNTWYKLTQRLAGTNQFTATWICFPGVNVSATHTVTVTLGGSSYPSIGVLAFNNVLANGIDLNTGAITSGATTLASGSLTPTMSKSLIISVAGLYSVTATPTYPSGFTGLFQANNPGVALALGMAYKISTDRSANNPSWTWTPSVPAVVSQVVLKPRIA